MSYSQVGSHRSMVFDEVRNELYAAAIRKLVTPDSVVLDLGAGLGIHGLIAAAAGAKRVYLVDPEPVVQIAKEIARANGLADRIVVLEGRIEDIELPEQVDLIVSVLTGNLLYTEDLLPSLFHARDRYLKPGGRLLPDRAELLLAPVSAPALHARHIGCWSEPHLGLDFSAARRFAANEMLWPRRDEFTIERLAPAATISSIDMTQATHADCRGEARLRIETGGNCDGLLGWIRIRLGDAWLSTDPAAPEVHWSSAILPLDPPLPLQTGEEILVSLQRPVYGDWTWRVSSASASRQQSCFLSRMDAPSRLRKLAPETSPRLSPRGRRALDILAMMRDGASNQAIARHLADADPRGFPDVETALREIQGFALRYGAAD